MSRNGNFNHPDVVNELASCMQDNIWALVEENVTMYPSMDLKSGIVTGLLQKHEGFLSNFMNLDPRGGIFSQDDVHKGLKKAIEKASLVERFEELSAQTDDLGGRIAYMIRVMLSHARTKGKDKSLPVIEAYVQKSMASLPRAGLCLVHKLPVPTPGWILYKHRVVLFAPKPFANHFSIKASRGNDAIN